MKFIKWFFGVLVSILLLAIIGLKISGNGFLIKGVWIVYLHGETSATINDAEYFDTRTVETGSTAQPWTISSTYNKTKLSDTLVSTLRATESVGYLVLKNGNIEHEEYWEDYGADSHSNSFSMAKSIVTLLTQIAIQKGIFNGWDDKVTSYLPRLEGKHKDQLELKHLSTMSAGLKWNEHYTNPFDITARAYYSDDVEEVMYKYVPVDSQPGTNFEYQSGATQYLAMALMEATGKSLSELASEWLWMPLGAENEALWSLDDEDGMEIAYCCFNSNLRDFARFGKLLIQNGNWEGKQLVDSSFIQLALQPHLSNVYGYSFWSDHDDHGSKISYMRGILGQYIIIVPEKNLVIVRLGHHRMPKSDGHSQDFHIIVDETIKAFR